MNFLERHFRPDKNIYLVCQVTLYVQGVGTLAAFFTVCSIEAAGRFGRQFLLDAPPPFRNAVQCSCIDSSRGVDS